MPANPGPDDTASTRAALRDKYQRMLVLRQQAPGSEGRAAMRALAEEFPGALRELDELPTYEIVRRVDELVGDAPLRDELRAVALFHAALRRRRPGSGRPSDVALRAVAEAFGVSVMHAHELVFPFAHRRRPR